MFDGTVGSESAARSLKFAKVERRVAEDRRVAEGSTHYIHNSRLSSAFELDERIEHSPPSSEFCTASSAEPSKTGLSSSSLMSCSLSPVVAAVSNTESPPILANDETVSDIPPSSGVFRVFEPWDLLRGSHLDVVKFNNSLVAIGKTADLVHYAPNCGTFSRARDRPIPGALFAPPPLRSSAFPSGLPNLSGKDKLRVDHDTFCADFSALSALERHRNQKFFSLEHPGRSHAHSLPSWKALRDTPGVFHDECHACMYPPCKRRKLQSLTHNIPELRGHVSLLCQDEKICTRTGAPHDSFKPVVVNSRVVSFPTSDEREYPKGWCEAYALGCRALSSRLGRLNFLEVFSGPNAPLSFSVSSSLGVPVEGNRDAMVLDSKEMKDRTELYSSSGDQTELGPVGSRQAPPEHELQRVTLPPADPEIRKATMSHFKGLSRSAALAAGRQSSSSLKGQLVPDGLEDPVEHLAQSKRCAFPQWSEDSLHEDVDRSIEALAASKREIVKSRLHLMSILKSKSEELKPEKDLCYADAAYTAKKLGCKLHVPLMKWLQDVTKVEDRAVPDLCLTGMPIVGDALESPFFHAYPESGTLTLSQLLSSAPARRKKIIDNFLASSSRTPLHILKEVERKTQKEVVAGTMGPPMEEGEVSAKFGPFWNVVPSFGIEQGLDESGKPKVRRIDDHTACENNAAANRKQKVPMATVNSVAAMARAVTRDVADPADPESSLQGATEDMKGAYRQVPLLPSHVMVAVTAVFYEGLGVRYHEMYGQPFGAAAAVTNFYRFSEWVCRALRRFFKMVMDHFFDDYFIVEVGYSLMSAVFCFREGCKLLGVVLDPDKSQLGEEHLAVLGVLFDLRLAVLEAKLFVCPKPSRVQNLTAELRRVVKDNRLVPSHAARVVGKFGFVCETMFGRVGRAATGAVRARQYQKGGTSKLTPHLRASLGLMIAFLQVTPPREVNLRPRSKNPCVLYTDASDVPGRGMGQYCVGAVLFVPHLNKLFYTSWAVPAEVVAQWVPKKTQIGQLEIFACPVALDTWHDLLRDEEILLFIDNTSAMASVIKGYSPKADSVKLVGDFWLRAAALRAHIFADHVESKSNIADGPSRFEFELLVKLGAEFTPPCTSFLLNSPSPDPFFWFAGRDNVGGKPAWG